MDVFSKMISFMQPTPKVNFLTGNAKLAEDPSKAANLGQSPVENGSLDSFFATVREYSTFKQILGGNSEMVRV